MALNFNFVFIIGFATSFSKAVNQKEASAASTCIEASAAVALLITLQCFLDLRINGNSLRFPKDELLKQTNLKFYAVPGKPILLEGIMLLLKEKI